MFQPTSQDYLDGISLLLPSKIYTHGTTFLGTPLGHPSFIHSHFMEVADEFDKRCKGLQSQLDDLQTKTSLFRMCLQGTIPHLLAADVALRSQSAVHPINPYAWSSPFLLRLNKTTSDFLSHISDHPASLFEPHGPRWIMAHALISMGGIGIQDYSARAVASFTVPLAQSIRCAIDGIHPKCSKDICLQVNPLLSQGLTNWKTSFAPLLVSFRRLSPDHLTPQDYKGIDNPLAHLVETLPLGTLLRDLVWTQKK
jgi:hypothetical protein